MTLLCVPLTRQRLPYLLRSLPTTFLSSSSRQTAFFHTTSHIHLQQKKQPGTEPKDKWNYNANPFDGQVDASQHDLQLITANALEKETKPPVGVRMLVRDFIEDSLYNPNYGYFPKQATIFNAQDTTFDFGKLRDSAEFQEEVAARYAKYGADKHDGPGRQLWHTPTELFKVSFSNRLTTSGIF